MVALMRTRQIYDAVVDMLNSDDYHTLLWGEAGPPKRFVKELYPGQASAPVSPSIGVQHIITWQHPIKGPGVLTLQFNVYAEKIADPVTYEDIISKMMPHVINKAAEYGARATTGEKTPALTVSETQFIRVTQNFTLDGGI